MTGTEIYNIIFACIQQSIISKCSSCLLQHQRCHLHKSTSIHLFILSLVLYLTKICDPFKTSMFPSKGAECKLESWKVSPILILQDRRHSAENSITSIVIFIESIPNSCTTKKFKLFIAWILAHFRQCLIKSLNG